MDQEWKIVEPLLVAEQMYGKKMPAAAGDCFFCEDGHSHGITCEGDEPVVFIALIINK